MISVKKQTKRTTKWLPDFANNINLFFKESKYDDDGSFQFAIITSKNWGDFSEINIKDPLIQITIAGKHYEMKLSEFKVFIEKQFA